MKPEYTLHHLCLTPASEAAFEETLAFYRDLLGLPLVRSWGEGETRGAMLDLGGALLELLCDPAAPAQGAGSIPHFALQAASVEQAVERVAAAGYPVTIQPQDGRFASEPPFGFRYAFCTGPCGEQLEFICPR